MNLLNRPFQIVSIKLMGLGWFFSFICLKYLKWKRKRKKNVIRKQKEKYNYLHCIIGIEMSFTKASCSMKQRTSCWKIKQSINLLVEFN